MKGPNIVRGDARASAFPWKITVICVLCHLLAIVNSKVHSTNVHIVSGEEKGHFHRSRSGAFLASVRRESRKCLFGCDLKRDSDVQIDAKKNTMWRLP